MNDLIFVDIQNIDIDPCITNMGDYIRVLIGNVSIKMTIDQYIEFNKKQGEFIKALYVPSIKEE